MANSTVLQKVLIFCPPFDGHLNVLKTLVLQSPSNFEWKIVITGWTNIPAKISEFANRVITLAGSDLNETDPTLWTLPRTVTLLDECLSIAREFQPDLILYDFFSLEGYMVGKILKIPVWCSIPAFIGDFTSSNYLSQKLSTAQNQSALTVLQQKYGMVITPSHLEMVSDGIHLPGDVNLIWSYESITPGDFKTNRHDKPYVFIGSPKVHTTVGHNLATTKQPLIYISFGTVVMNNLWNQQPEIRAKLTTFIRDVAAISRDQPWNIVFVSQGKKIMEQYPDNWSVYESVDQVAMLEQASVFVTHGGSNSFHESVISHTPLVVIPFFGDQPLVAQTVHQLGFGIDLAPSTSINTDAPRHYLNHSLALSLDRAVQTILVDDSYKRNIERTELRCSNVYSLLSRQISFNEGDLLFGTNVARQKYINDNKLHSEFTILMFEAFSKLAPHTYSLPRIIDIYHDVILNQEYFETDQDSDMTTYIEHLSNYKRYLAGETDFEKMCIKGLDFFTRYYKIHFILNEYDPKINRITKAEIAHILANQDRFQNHVTFYRQIGNYWIPISYSEVKDMHHESSFMGTNESYA